VVITILLLSIRAKLFPAVDEDLTDIANQIVFSISILVPVVPVFWYLVVKFRKILVSNPSAIEDIFFKKTIRFHLVISIIFGVLWVITLVYNILAKVFLNNLEITTSAILDGFIFTIVSCGLAFFFFYYQNKTKR